MISEVCVNHHDQAGCAQTDSPDMIVGKYDAAFGLEHGRFAGEYGGLRFNHGRRDLRGRQDNFRLAGFLFRLRRFGAFGGAAPADNQRCKRKNCKRDAVSLADSFGGFQPDDALMIFSHASRPGEIRIDARPLGVQQPEQIGAAFRIRRHGDLRNVHGFLAKRLQRGDHFIATHLEILQSALVLGPDIRLDRREQLLSPPHLGLRRLAITLITVSHWQGDLKSGDDGIYAIARVG